MDLRVLLPMVYNKLKGDQQDAQEWFHFFLEAIDNCRSQIILLSNSPSANNNKNGNYNDKLKEEEDDDDDEPILQLNLNNFAGNSLVSSRFIIPQNNYKKKFSISKEEEEGLFKSLRIPFMGSLESHLRCTSCSSHTVKMEGFFDIPLSIQGSNHRTLEELLFAFTHREQISDFFCESCSRKVTIEKWMTIGRMPKCLCITIRRNAIGFGGQAKISKHIAFPPVLNCSHFISDISPTSVGVYKLKSIIEHHGGVDGASGHYTTIRSTPTSWYYISDELVSEIDEYKVYSASAYMLFYELV